MKTEKVFATLFLIGLIFWFFNIVGDVLILIFSLFSLSLMYLFGAFYFFSDKTIRQQNHTLSIISGIFLAVLPMAILYRLMFWPGALIISVFGCVTGLVLFTIVYLISKDSSAPLKRYYNNMIIRTGVLLVCAWLLLLIPAKTLINVKYRNDPEMARVSYMYLKNPTEENKKQRDDYVEQKRVSEFRQQRIGD